MGQKERMRVRRRRDLQQCLSVRNSVVYINCNLFHSLSGPEELCVCCVCEKQSVSVYMPVHMCISPCVCVCVRALTCAAYVCAGGGGIRPAVYSVHYKARRCLQQYIYAAPQLGRSGSPRSPRHSYG